MKKETGSKKSNKKISIFQLFLLILIFIILGLIAFDIKPLSLISKTNTQKVQLPIKKTLLKKANKAQEKINKEIVQNIKEDIDEQKELKKEVVKLNLDLEQSKDEITALTQEINTLKGQIIHQNISEQQLKITHLLIDIQSKVNNGKIFKDELNQLEISTKNNSYVADRVYKLMPYSIIQIKTKKQITNLFEKEVQSALKNNLLKKEKGIKNRFKNFFCGLITIRKTQNNYSAFDENSIDFWLFKIEKEIKNENYKKALNEINNNQNFNKYLADTKKSLEDLTIVNKLLEELIEYNKASTTIRQI